MEDEQYSAIYSCLEHVTYPAGLTKSKIFAKITSCFTDMFKLAVPLKDKSAVSVARGIYKVYCRQGAPIHIISDQEKEFANQVAIYNRYIFMSMHGYVTNGKGYYRYVGLSSSDQSSTSKSIDC